MTAAQYVVLCAACLGFVGAVVGALLPKVLVNKNKEVYLLKKQAILESLNFLDDHMANYLVKSGAHVVRRGEGEDLTLRARDCLNKLLITCKNKKIIETFCALVYPQGYGKESPDIEDYISFKILCRRALGLSTKLARDAETIAFLSDLNACGNGVCHIHKTREKK